MTLPISNKHRAPTFAAAALLALAGCVADIAPPAHIVEPAHVAVLSHGRHASLVLEAPGEGAMIRYAYGEWHWYALRQTGALEAGRAVLWPSRAALGRKRIERPFSPEAVRREVRVSIEEAIYLEAEAEVVSRLIARLDGTFRTGGAPIHNAVYDLEFVEHPDAYWIFHNSNHKIAEWLGELGFSVEGGSILSDWRRAAPQGH